MQARAGGDNVTEGHAAQRSFRGPLPRLRARLLAPASRAANQNEVLRTRLIVNRSLHRGHFRPLG